jgi:hypothetical protein
MATTTPNYGWAVPTSTDLVKDGATAIETLGDAIDASMNTALGTKKAGMVLLNTTSFSGVASQSLPTDTFTSTYSHYVITLSISSASATSSLKLRLRAAGSDTIGSAYQSSVIATRVSGATFNANAQNANYGYLGNSNLNAPFPALQFMIFNPKDTVPTNWSGTGSYRDGTSNYFGAFGGVLDNSTSYDSATILPDSGTFSGVISCYGVNK